jgi:hypothetical protein
MIAPAPLTPFANWAKTSRLNPLGEIGHRQTPSVIEGGTGTDQRYGAGRR